jgi:hypothetical protein
MSGARLGTLTATGKPVELTRFIGPFHLVVVQLTAETGYVQVGAAELLRILLNPTPQDVPDPWELLETAYAGLVRLQVPGERPITDAFILRLHDVLEARRVALATPEPPKP